MGIVCFIQHLTPDQDVEIHIDRPDDVSAKAEYIHTHHFQLECEVTGCGDIVIFVSDATRTTYAMRISKPGTKTLPLSVDTLILDFDVAKAVRQRAALSAASF